MDNFIDRHLTEKLQRDELEQLFAKTKLSKYELIRNFPVFTPRLNLARFILHYELFKKIYQLPGIIIDLGVYKGASTFTWAKLCEIFCPSDVKKKVVGFDTFEGFPELSSEDGKESRNQDKIKGGYNAGGASILGDLESAQKAMNHDKFIKHINRIEFIKGDVMKTIPEFIEKQGNGLKVCLLNLDVDLYKPTKSALEYFVPLMVKGGIIILDEYADHIFGGETKAVDEYFMEQFSAKPDIKKFHWHSNPSGYIIMK